MKALLRQKITDIVDAAKDLAIATIREDGSPQNTTVSFVHDGLTLYFACAAGCQKARNISRDARVSATLTAPYETWNEIKGLSMSARAHAVTGADEIDRVRGLIAERFPQVADLDTSELEDVAIYAVVPEVVSVLDYTLGFGHTDLVLVSEGDIAETRGSDTHIWLPATA